MMSDSNLMASLHNPNLLQSKKYFDSEEVVNGACPLVNLKNGRPATERFPISDLHGCFIQMNTVLLYDLQAISPVRAA